MIINQKLNNSFVKKLHTRKVEKYFSTKGILKALRVKTMLNGARCISAELKGPWRSSAGLGGGGFAAATSHGLFPCSPSFFVHSSSLFIANLSFSILLLTDEQTKEQCDV